MCLNPIVKKFNSTIRRVNEEMKVYLQLLHRFTDIHIMKYASFGMSGFQWFLAMRAETASPYSFEWTFFLFVEIYQ